MTRRPPPCVIALGDPNGAGKSTVGPGLMRGSLHATEFVNPDVITQGFSAFKPDAVAIAAGRVMHAHPGSWPGAALTPHLRLRRPARS